MFTCGLQLALPSNLARTGLPTYVEVYYMSILIDIDMYYMCILTNIFCCCADNIALNIQVHIKWVECLQRSKERGGRAKLSGIYIYIYIYTHTHISLSLSLYIYICVCII